MLTDSISTDERAARFGTSGQIELPLLRRAGFALLITLLITANGRAQFGPPFTSPAALNSNAATDGVNDDDKEISLATDGAGNWVVVWSSTDTLGGTVGTDKDIFVSRSTDNGATWTAAAALNSNATTDGAADDDKKPWIATDDNGAWVVVWESVGTLGGTVGTDKDIFWSKSTDNGVTWAAVAALNSNAATDGANDDDKSPHLAADSATTSNWIVVWESLTDLGTNGTDGDLMVSRSADNAATWSAVALLNSNATTDAGKDKAAFVATDTAGAWVVVWESDDTLGTTVGTDKDIFWSRSVNNGSTWSAVAALNSNAATDGVNDDDKKPVIAADTASTSNWIVVWESATNLGSNGTDGDILEAHSTDDGTTWSSIALLNSNAATDTGQDKEAFVVTDDAGRWVVAWSTDDTLGTTVGVDKDLVWACSNDVGLSWSAISVLNTNADTDTGDDKKPVLATDGACHWVIAWESDDTLGATIGTDKDVLTARPESGVGITSNLTAFLKLNDGSGTTATDSSGNSNNGTVTNASWNGGMFGGALDFDGAGDYTDVPTSIAGTNVGSAAFWFRTSTNFGADAIMYYGSNVATGNGNGAENELHVNFTSAETIQFFIAGATNVSLTTTNTYADGAWHHVAATWDINNFASLYVDGKFVESAFHNANNFTFSSTHRLARPGANSNLFTGRIDDVRLYSRVITACEIAKLSKGHGLLAHWKFDDGAGGTATDSVGSNNGTLTGPPTWVDGHQCGALDFNGTSDYVSMGDVLDLADTDDVTITGWFSRDTHVNKHVLVAKRSATDTGPATGYILFIVGGTNDNLRFRVDDGTNVFTLDSTTTFTSTAWNHFAVVWDQDSAANTKIYINGVDDNASQSGTISSIGSLANALPFRIGAQSDNGKPFDGKIDDIRIYNRVLSTEEIQATAATYTLIDLGSLNGQRGLGIAINNSEQVAGFDQATANGAESAWRSQFCLMTGLGTLTGGSVSAALGINDAGTVCGWSDETGGTRKAFTWTSGGGFTNLGTLAGKTDSEATGINANGEVSGTSLNLGSTPSGWAAFLYLPVAAYSLPMGMNSLGTLGGAFSVAMDLNDSGQVVGGSSTSADFVEPFIWLPSAAYSLSAGMNSLGTLGGNQGTLIHRAQAINNKGETVGRSYTAALAGHAFIWLPSAAYTLSSGMNDLGVLTGGSSSFAFDINESGEVVGTSNITGGAFHAFIWANGTMTDLNNLIDTNSAWTLTRAVGINNDGEIVGWGTDGSGNVKAFILVQTCSTGQATLGSLAGILIADITSKASVQGVIGEVLVDEAGTPLAELQVVDAPPAADFDISVRAESLIPGRGSSARALPTAGLVDASAVDRTLQIKTTTPPGSFKATVGLIVSNDELDALGVLPEDLALHVFDSARLRWVPAGENVGESAPTDVLGDAGFVPNVDGTITFWAVRDRLSVFAVGAPERASEPGTDVPAEAPVPAVCGLGIIQAGLISFAGLMLMSARRRRFTG